MHAIVRIRGTTGRYTTNWLFVAQSSSSDMFTTCRAEEWRTWTVLVTVYDDAGNGIIVPSYLLSPVPREDSGALKDIVDEDTCLEHHRDVPSDVVDTVLRFLWGLSFPLVSLWWFFVNMRGLKRGFDDRLRGQFGQIRREFSKQGECVGF